MNSPTVCAKFTEIDIYTDMEHGVFTYDHERMSTGNSGHKAINRFFKNIPHVSSWPQSPEAHRTGREPFFHHAMLSLSSDGPFDSFFTFLTPSRMAVEVVTLK